MSNARSELLGSVIGGIFGAALACAPANATLVTSVIAVDITRAYFTGDSAETICEPCGPNTITYTFDPETDLPTDWSFDWYGVNGIAHVMYRDSQEQYQRSTDEVASYGYLYSDWNVTVDGLRWHDFIYAEEGYDGTWFTAEVGTEAIHADFTVPAIYADRAPPPAVPEPTPLSLLLAGMTVAAWVRLTSRNQGSVTGAYTTKA